MSEQTNERGKSVPETPSCAYCGAPLGIADLRFRILACPTCSRPLLVVKERLFGVRFAKSGTVWLTLLAQLVCVPVFGGLIVLGLLVKSTRLVASIILLWLFVLAIIMIHEGYVSIRTRTMARMRRLIVGNEAMVQGLIWLVVGCVILVVAIAMLVMEFAYLLRVAMR